MSYATNLPRSGVLPMAPALPVVYLSDGPLPTRCARCRSRLVREDDLLLCLLHEMVRIEVQATRPAPPVSARQRARARTGRAPLGGERPDSVYYQRPLIPCADGCGRGVRKGNSKSGRCLWCANVVKSQRAAEKRAAKEAAS